MSKNRYDALRETALTNFELLLQHWGIEYERVDNEYDFRNPTRDDRHFGACRFNIEKGYGADFALRDLYTDAQFKAFGIGFTKDDFSAYNPGATVKAGFDIIGLCQRLHGYDTYQDGAIRLRDDLNAIQTSSTYTRINVAAAIERRRTQGEFANVKKVEYANRIWRACRKVAIEGTAGEKYLQGREINIREPSIRFHPFVKFPEKKVLPALIFKVSKEPDGPLTAIHRIYLTDHGTKADVSDPKRALARIQGCGIWFGEKGEKLYIVEGPENALSYRVIGAQFVVSTINATNYHSLTIPDYVKTIVLAPDLHDAGAGYVAHQKALESYKKRNIVIKRGGIG